MRTIPAVGLLVAMTLGASPASAKIRVVASTTDLGSIAAAVGGEQVEVAAIGRPGTDPHRVEVLPSYMVRVSRAKLYLRVGLGLDTWSDQIIDGSHNGDLTIVDCSQAIPVLEKPTGRVDASMGDVHPGGNPHYWLDPRNGGIVARTIADALAKVDPAHAADYSARAEELMRQCDAEAVRGRDAVAGIQVKEIITYHRSWTYLADAFGLVVAGTVEPVPGIPPTARHLSELVALIRARGVPLILAEPYFNDEAGSFLHRETGVRVAKISPSCDDVTPESYLAHFGVIIEALSGLEAPAN